MNISAKLALGISIVALMLVTSGVIAINGLHQLSNSFSTAPATETVKTPQINASYKQLKQPIIAIQGALISPETNQLLLDASQDLAEQLQRLSKSEGVDQWISRVTVLTDKQQKHLSVLIKQQNYLFESQQQFVVYFEQIINLLQQAEKISNNTITTLKENPNLAMSWQGGLQDKWQASNGITSIQLKIIEHRYHHQVVINNSIEMTDQTALSSIIDELALEVTKLINSPSFYNAKIPEGQFRGHLFQEQLPLRVKEYVATSTSIRHQYQQQQQESNALQKINHQLLTQLSNIPTQIDVQTKAAAPQRHNIEEAVSNIQFNIILTLIMGLIAAAVSYWFSLKTAVKPMQQLLYNIQHLTQNGKLELNHSLPETGSNESKQLSQAINRVISHVHSTMGDIHQTAQQITEQNSQLEILSSQSVQSANNQQAEFNQVSNVISELSQTSGMVAENASQVAQANAKASSQTEQGREVVSRMLEQINKLTQGVNHSTDVINHLDQDAKSIEKIIDVIHGIADQTNLLALNAAIEAARAGDQGRGFAVVADEVRLLATRSQSSAKEINQLIERLRTDSQDAVKVMAESKETADETMGKTEQLNEAFINIADAVNQANRLATQIESTAREQSSLASNVTGNITNIKDISQESSHSNQQLVSTVDELNATILRLNQLINGFNL